MFNVLDVREVEPRSEWVKKNLKGFINSDQSKFSIPLYSGEVKRLRNQYPNLQFEIGDYTKSKPDDKRHNCTVFKSN